ncbi:MAG: DoxX family membrane protein [Bacteroidales bacterium]|nr:DoxX family membrane protein [Bacteroidales bacterium]
MSGLESRFSKIDFQITTWMARNGVLFLRLSVGFLFLWYGILKFFPSVSSAENIATTTIEQLSFGIVNGRFAMILLAVWETMIGLGLMSGKFLRETLLLLFLQMIGTLAPLVLLPDITFTIFPIVPSLEGQYIIKNLVLISAGIAIGATVRGGRLVAEPKNITKS